MFVLFIMQSYLIEVRGLKLHVYRHYVMIGWSYLIEVRGLKPTSKKAFRNLLSPVVSYRGTWVETPFGV